MAKQGVERCEHALGCFGAEEALPTRGTCSNGRVEHEVLCLNGGPFHRTAGWTFRFGYIQQVLKFFHFESVRVGVVSLQKHISSTGFFACAAHGHEI